MGQHRRWLRLVGWVIAALCVLWTAPAGAAKIAYTGWGSPSELESIEAEIAAFYEKYPEFEVEIENRFVPWEGYHEKLIVQAAAGALPDVMLISGSFFTNVEAYNVFLDLRPYFERDRLRYDYLPSGSVNFLTINRKLSALPAAGFRPGGAMMNFNQEMFDAAGLAYPAWDWTWDELLQNARRLTQDTNGDGQTDRYGVDFAKTTWEGVWEYLLRAYGGSVWKEDASASAINSPSARFAFTFLKDLDDRWRVSGSEFLQGDVGISAAWAGEASRRLDVAPFRAGVLPMPKGPNGRGLGAPSGRVHVYAIAKNTRYPDAAWRFVRFLVTEPEAALARHLNSVAGPGYLPAAEQWVKRFPPEKQNWLEIGLLDQREAPVRPEAPQNALLIPYDDFQRILTGWLQRFYSGQVPVDAALAGIERDANVRLAEVRQRESK